MGWVANITARTLYRQGRNCRYPSLTKWVRPKSGRELFGKEKISCPCRESNPLFLRRSARHLAWLVYCTSYGNMCEDNMCAFCESAPNPSTVNQALLATVMRKASYRKDGSALFPDWFQTKEHNQTVCSEAVMAVTLMESRREAT